MVRRPQKWPRSLSRRSNQSPLQWRMEVRSERGSRLPQTFLKIILFRHFREIHQGRLRSVSLCKRRQISRVIQGREIPRERKVPLGKWLVLLRTISLGSPPRPGKLALGPQQPRHIHRLLRERQKNRLRQVRLVQRLHLRRRIRQRPQVKNIIFRHGKGRLTYQDGKEIKGTWEDGNLVSTEQEKRQIEH